jgi:hypothetical protein
MAHFAPNTVVIRSGHRQVQIGGFEEPFAYSIGSPTVSEIETGAEPNVLSSSSGPRDLSQKSVQLWQECAFHFYGAICIVS